MVYPIGDRRACDERGARSHRIFTTATSGGAYAQSLCRPCRNAAQEELKKCLEAVISQEDKQWCQKKQGARVEACEHGECQLEKAQQAAQREALS
jgi:hypothetical protein